MIMKKNIISFLFFSLAIIIAGCTSEEFSDISCKKDDGNSILRLEISMEDMTRGMITSKTFKEGDEVLVILMEKSIDSWGTSIDCKATYKNGVWDLDTIIDFSKPYVVGSETREWPDRILTYVVYPYDKVYNPHSGFALFASNDILSQNDILQGSSYVEKNNAVAKISCSHVLTSLSFNVKNNSNRPVMIDSLTVSQKPMEDTFNGYGLYTFLPQFSYFNVDDSYFMGLSRYDNFAETYTCKYNVSIKPGETGKIDFLLSPTDVIYSYYSDYKSLEYPLQPLQFEISVNGLPLHFDLQPSSWVAGKNYIYPVTIASSFIKEIEPTKVYMYDTYDGKHVYWSNINVGATSEIDYGRLFGWADPSGTFESENLNDYPNANPPENIAGTNYDIATVNWGGKWRMPTNSDIWSLKVKTEEPEWTEVNGVYGVKVTSTETGESIFFPEAPQRVGTVITHYNSSYYWLSELNKNDNTMAGTLYFDYNEMYSSPLSFYPTAGLKRYTGLPVRAIWIDD